MVKAVIFDIGGVVLQSPFIAIAEYEREQHLPKDYINVAIVSRGSQGAWQRFERGQLDIFPFYDAFGQDLSDTEWNNPRYESYCTRKRQVCPPLPKSLKIDGRDLFGRMMRSSAAYDPYILTAIRRIKESGSQYRIIALTNNFAGVGSIPDSERDFLGWGKEGPVPSHLRQLFHDFCDSSTLGMRKPDPEFYLLACQRNDVKPSDAVFLDDIPENVKTAKELGMQTIHVRLGKTLEAVRELERILGMELIGGENQHHLSVTKL